MNSIATKKLPQFSILKQLPTQLINSALSGNIINSPITKVTGEFMRSFGHLKGFTINTCSIPTTKNILSFLWGMGIKSISYRALVVVLGYSFLYWFSLDWKFPFECIRVKLLRTIIMQMISLFGFPCFFGFWWIFHIRLTRLCYC